MANQLNMATIDTILTLRQQGWSVRRIARTLGIHRDTVARHLQQAKSGQAPIGSEEAKTSQAPIGSAEAKSGQAPIGSEGGARPIGDVTPAEPVTVCERPRQHSLCEPFRAVIQAKLDLGLTAQRIFQDLVADHNFGGKYSSVRRFVRQTGADAGTAVPASGMCSW